MPGRVFKEKQLRLCVVAALTSLSAPVAESLLLPPKPLASNLTWRCDSGLAQQRLCNHTFNPNHRYARNNSIRKANQQPVDSTPAVNQTAYSQTNEQPDLSESNYDSESTNSLLTLSGDQYVLQWMATKERSQLEGLKQSYPVLKSALIARYERAGNVWFVLLDGPFQNRADAMQQLTSPPRSAMAKELYPWTRSLASIQKLNPIVSDPSYQIAENNLQAPEQELVSRSAPLLVTTEQTAPYINQQYTDPSPYNNDDYPSQQVEVTANRQGNYDRNRNIAAYQPQMFEREVVLPYGAEFDEVSYSKNQPVRAYQRYQVIDNTQNSYTSSSPVFREPIARQTPSTEVNYNLQSSERLSYRQPETPPEPRRIQSFNVQSQLAANVLTANPKSYTIEWMSSNRRASLERAQLRYSELQNTQIVRYTRNNRQRYLLVSMLFVNRADALDVLLTPSLARISARFSPKVRQVADLQTLVENTTQDNNTWVSPSLEPSIHKRHWIRTEDLGDKKYIVQRTIKNQQTEPFARNSYSTLPQTVSQKMHEPDRQPVINKDREQLTALLNTPGDAYTIQWFSSSNLQSIEQLKQRFPQLQDAVTVRVRKDNRQWYVLVQGQYKNSQEAIRALKSPSMKTIAMVLHPWTRPVDSLKKLNVATL